jgi:hypothetical protein
MELRVEITKTEIKRLQKEYAKACNDPDKRKPRLKERDWIGREILQALPSGATSQKGQWAVTATLRPLVEEALCKVPKYRRELAKEKREEEQRIAEVRQIAEDRKQQNEKQTAPLRKHLQGCQECTLAIDGTDYLTIEFTGLKPSGRICDIARALTQQLIDSNVLHWRGPGDKSLQFGTVAAAGLAVAFPQQPRPAPTERPTRAPFDRDKETQSLNEALNQFSKNTSGHREEEEEAAAN